MTTPTRAAACALLALVVAAGCGNTDTDASGAATTTPTAEPAAAGNWLLRFNTAEGADGELSRAVYVTYDPATGNATVKRMPGVVAADSYGDAQALLVNADHAWSLLDTKVGREGRKGRITLYATAGKATWTLPLRSWSNHSGLRAMAAAFDPAEPDLLRVVDTDRQVWKVDIARRSATEDGRLPRRAGWIFGNGFDKNSGVPYIEDIDSDQTDPAGNGDSDARPVERQGGQLRYYDGGAIEGLPALPCGFAGGFTDADGTSWLFCADTPSVAAYRVVEGGSSWEPYGTSSVNVVPGVASELAVVLPPVD